MENKIQTIEQFKAAAAEFLATVEALDSLRTVREQFAPLNEAICNNSNIPPSEWDTCDAVIAAYKKAFARLHGRPEPAPVAPLRVIAIREDAKGNRTQGEWMRAATPGEASTVIGLMIGQDGIVDGYWIEEGDELLPIAQTAQEEAARVTRFHAAMAVPSPLFGAQIGL